MQAENVGLPNDSDDNGDNYDDDHDDKIKDMVGNYAHQSWVCLPYRLHIYTLAWAPFEGQNGGLQVEQKAEYKMVEMRNQNIQERLSKSGVGEGAC